MRVLSSIGLAALLGGSCLIGSANANTIDFGLISFGTATYTGASLDKSTAFNVSGSTLFVNAVGGSDQSGLANGDALVSISPTNIQYGSGSGNLSVALVASLTKSWTIPSGPFVGAYTEVLSTVDNINRSSLNTVAVLIEGLINGPGFTNQQVFLLLNANQAAGPGVGNAINWSLTESSTNPFLNPTPLPAALPLFAGGLGVIGLLARRRKRKVAALAV